jgi:hypothetical protein
MANMFGFVWALDTTPMTNIENRPWMIMAGMETNRKPILMAELSSQAKVNWYLTFL